jgi:hypothetical protein
MAGLPGNTASGNISPCRFLKLTGDFRMGQCVAGEQADAVSREFVRDVPQTGSSPLAAALGEPVQVASFGEMCEIEVGAAVVAGAWVKPDANGRAVPAVAADKASGRVYRGQAVVGNRALIVVRNGVA